MNLVLPVNPEYLSPFIFMIRVTDGSLGSDEDANCHRLLSRAIKRIYWRMIILIIEMNGLKYLGFTRISVSKTDLGHVTKLMPLDGQLNDELSSSKSLI